MKKLILNRQLVRRAIIGGFVLASLLSFVCFDGICNNVEDKVLRLHVKANSDSEFDQQIKLAVKDEVFTLVNSLTGDCASAEEAESIIAANLDIIGSAANECLESKGVTYGAAAYIDESFFDTRDYGEFALPAGRYHALRIDLGEAEGQNWWCAVYPALCTSSAVKYDDFTEREATLITKEAPAFEVRFKFYELYRRLADALSK